MDNPTHPAAERLLPVALLTLSGGLQDTYTYLRRGRVFANAQTGNIVLLGQSLFDGDWSRAARYLFPVLAFALGVGAAEWGIKPTRNSRRISHISTRRCQRGRRTRIHSAAATPKAKANMGRR